MRISFLILSGSLVLPFVGRADQPAAPEPAAAPAAAAAPGENAAPADPKVEEKTSAQLKKDAAEAKIRQFGVNGYKPENTKGGGVVYCKKETPIGSRFETKQCRTFEQLREESLNGKEYLEQLQRVVPPNKG